jgi:hypothetical protein
MIWIILYAISIPICLGIIFYTENIELEDNNTILAVMVAIVWPMYLVVCTLLGLGHCIRLLLTKIFKTK